MKPFTHQGFLVALSALAIAGAGCSQGETSIASLPATPGAAMQSTLLHALQPDLTSVEFHRGITHGSTPRGVTQVGNFVFFTEPAVDKIARSSSDGVIKEFPVTPGTAPGNIALGSDGNLWYTEAGDAVGRMTPKGVVTDFPVGNEAYGPFDIVAGPDGNLWFTFRSPSTNAIGRITTAGSSTLFTTGLSPGDVAVHDLSLGPDGNIWFTEEFANQIGKITPSGTITEYAAGLTQNATLVDISGGPDGNVWFTENSANQVGRITPSGTITEFPAPASSGPGTITSDGGYLWFCENAVDKLARLATDGTIKTFAIPGQSCFDIARGPAHAVWITDYNGNGLIKTQI